MLALAAAVLATEPGCAPPPLPEIDTGVAAPSIRITWPPPEASVSGCELVAVEVENFDLVEFPGDPEEGRGHYHIYHPGGYRSCYKPYCFVDFSTVTTTNEPYFVAVLADSTHDELVDDDGDLIQDQIPFDFQAGPCTLDGDTHSER